MCAGIEPSQAEVENLHVSVVADHDVLGFHVTMHEARGVSDAQRFGHLPRETLKCRYLDRLANERPKHVTAYRAP